MYNGGLCISMGNDFVEVYFPLFESDDIARNLDANGYKFKDKIRFVLNLTKLAPAKVRDNILTRL